MDFLPQRPLDRPYHRFRLLRSRHLHRHPLHPQLRRRQLPNLLCLCTRWRYSRPQCCWSRLPSVCKPDVHQARLRVGEQSVGFLEYHHDPYSLAVVLLWREIEIEESFCKRAFCSRRGCAALISLYSLLVCSKSMIECCYDFFHSTSDLEFVTT